MAIFMRQMIILCQLLAVSPAALVSPATAKDLDHDDAREMVQSGDIMPLETLLNQVGKSHPGKVLEVEMERKRGRVIYELEVLDKDGQVWELRFDAASGRLLKQERED